MALHNIDLFNQIGTKKWQGVVTTHSDKLPFAEIQNGAPTLLELSPPAIDGSKIWAVTPPIPAAVSAEVVSVVAAVVDNGEAIAGGGARSYKIVDYGTHGVNDDAIKDWVSPIYDPTYRAVLYRYDLGTSAWIEIPWNHACEWVVDYGGGFIIVLNNDLPAGDVHPVDGVTYKLEGYVYIGPTLASLSSGGMIGTIKNSDNSSVFNSIDTLIFDKDQVVLTQPSAGQVLVTLSGKAQQFGDPFVYTVPAAIPTEITLPDATRVPDSSFWPKIRVYVNGIRQRYGVDYSVSGSQLAPPVKILWISARYNLVENDEIIIDY